LGVNATLRDPLGASLRKNPEVSMGTHPWG